MERQVCRRRRPALSCLECRRRKIKCDRADPCVHCIAAKTPCTYKVYRNIHESAIRQQSQQDISANSTVSAVPCAPQDQQIRSNGAITEPAHRAQASAAEAPSHPPLSMGRDDIEAPNSAQDPGSDRRNLLRRLQKLEETSASPLIHGLSETGRHILACQFGLQDSQIILNKTRILRWSHWMGSAQQFAPMFACYAAAGENDKGASSRSPETEALHGHIGELLHKCKITARSIKIGRPSTCLGWPELGLASLPRELADTMANLYFQSFESAHRILHAPTFWAEYETFWNHPEVVTIGLRLKVLLVIAIGSSLHEHGDRDVEFRNMTHQCIVAAQNWLSGPLEKDRLNIAGLQIHCLAILARQIFSVGGDLVWISMGSLIHTAMQIGLHHDPKHLPATSVLEAELRRRLWATILELLVQSSLDSAMPPRISFDDFDTEAPSNNNDEEMDDSTTLLRPHTNATYTTTSVQICLLKSLPTRLRILQLLNGLHANLSYLEVLALDSEITDVCRTSNAFMKANSEPGVTPFHRNMLDYLVRRFLLPLHCAFARNARSNPLFYYSRKVSLDAAMAIVCLEPDQGFSHLMAIGGGLFREGLMMAAMAISLELVIQVEEQRLDGTLHCHLRSRSLLKQALKDMLEVSFHRIRHGETGVKTPIFLSMVLAQAEAMEAGASCDFKIAQSAELCLEGCHNLLRTRLAAVSLSVLDDAGVTLMSLGSGQEGYELDMDWDFFFPEGGF